MTRSRTSFGMPRALEKGVSAATEAHTRKTLGGGYDSPAGSRNIRNLPDNRLLLRQGETARPSGGAGGTQSGRCCSCPTQAEYGGRLLRSRQSALPSRPHLGSER